MYQPSELVAGKKFNWDCPDTFSGSVQRVAPRARDDLPHEGLAAAVGGPLAVLPREKVNPDSASDPQSLMLADPRVPIEISIDPTSLVPLRAGQIGEVAIRSRKQTLGEFVYERMAMFIKRNNSRTHGL